MHFDAEAIHFRVRLRKAAQGLTRAEADLQHAGGAAAERAVQQQRLAGELDAVGGPQVIERALLSRRGTAGAQHEAANRAPRRGSIRELVGRRCWLMLLVGHETGVSRKSSKYLLHVQRG